MAKAKSTTRGKTKTVKKTSAAKISRSGKPAKASVIKQLNLLHVINLVIAIVGIGLTFVLMPAIKHSLTLSYQAKDTLAGNDSVLVPASRVWFELDLRWLLAALLAVLGVYSLLVLTRWKESYRKGITSGLYLWRWVFMGVVGVLFVDIISMVNGVEDVMTLKLMAAAVVLAAGLSWLAERQNEKSKKPVYSALTLAALSGLMPVLVVGQYLLSTYVYGMMSLEWHNYVLGLIMLISFALVGLNQLLKYRGVKQWQDNQMVELNYIVVSLVSKLSLLVVLLIAFN